MDTAALLQEFSDAHGVSGYEDAPRAIAQRVLEPLVDSMRVDALGNLITFKKGTGDANGKHRTMMLAAHMDEIGMMVTGYSGGFLRVFRVGGSDPRTLVGQEVVVHGVRDFPGVIASRPPHVLSAEDRKKTPDWNDLYIDIGATADEIEGLVTIGDTITLRSSFVKLSGGYAAGKAMDDRASVVTIALCMQELAGVTHEWDIAAVATTQEEVGLRGAIVSAFGVAPDAAIAIDVGFGAQVGVDPNISIKMDAGPCLSIGPNFHPTMYQGLVDVAQKREIKIQSEVIPGASGTDAWGIQIAREGVPTALLGLPLRYMHSSVETVAIADVERTGRLMAAFIQSLKGDIELDAQAKE